ncbi:MAG: hypothetical protein CL910_21900 [Deltaproteobacteria bacterium]|jgi:predicted dithiol-disulfide oxidoreductase (DUF899 family)|nr:hypothetical protein [Deltaproteobacteria bacterium]
MTARHPAESPAYAKLRDELQEAEVALRDQRERVAALRRSLPRDTVVPDETFEEIVDGVRVPVKLSELFTDGDKPLILMHFMYGGSQEQPCPMCTMWADGYEGAIPHIEERANFAILVAGDVGAFAEYARSRGWSKLRIVSAAGSAIKRELGFETEDGAQLPGVSIFSRSDDGGLVHFYSQCAFLGEHGFRGMDLLSPVWNYFDLTPEGRGDFMPSKSYAT